MAAQRVSTGRFTALIAGAKIPNAGIGSVSGRIVAVGGPPGGPHLWPATGYVSAWLTPDGSGKPVSTVYSDVRGNFHVSLAAGRYYVGALNSARDPMSTRTQLFVEAGRDTHLRLTAYVP